jgi:hypothetical protein
MQRLRTDAATTELALGIERLSDVRPESVPTLADFIAGRLPPIEAVDLGRSPTIDPYPVLDLRRREALKRPPSRAIAVGEILGVDTHLADGRDADLELTVGQHTGAHLRVLIRPETLGKLTAHRRNSIRVGAVVAVTGTITSYEGIAQIILEKAPLLDFPSEDRVRGLLGSFWLEAVPAWDSAYTLRAGDVVDHHRFGEGIVQRVEGDYADIRFPVELKRIAYRIYTLRLVRRAPAGYRPAAPPPSARKRLGPSPRPRVPRPVPATTFDQDMTDWMHLVKGAGPPVHPRGGAKATSGASPAVQRQRKTASTKTGPVAPHTPASKTTTSSVRIPLALLIGATILAIIGVEPVIWILLAAAGLATIGWSFLS